jgi:hypothetical protein
MRCNITASCKTVRQRKSWIYDLSQPNQFGCRTITKVPAKNNSTQMMLTSNNGSLRLTLFMTRMVSPSSWHRCCFYSRADRELRGKIDRSGTRSGRAAKLIAATSRIDVVTPIASPTIP